MFDAFDPVRNIGIGTYQPFWDEFGTYSVGVFKGNSDGTSGNAFDYSDGQYAFTGRLTLCPWYMQDGRYVFHMGLAASQRMQDPDVAGGQARFSATIPLRVGSPNVVDTGLLKVDNYQLFNGQLAMNLNSLSLQAEYVNAQVHNLRRGAFAPGVPRLVNTAFDGFYVQAGYFLTGEFRPYKRASSGWDRVHVIEPFFCQCRDDGSIRRGLGAWEVVVRYDYLDLDSQALAAFTAPAGGTNAAAVATRRNRAGHHIRSKLVPAQQLQSDVELRLRSC